MQVLPKLLAPPGRTFYCLINLVEDVWERLFLLFVVVAAARLLVTLQAVFYFSASYKQPFICHVSSWGGKKK